MATFVRLFFLFLILAFCYCTDLSSFSITTAHAGGKPPVLLVKVPPKYPEVALTQCVEGRVIIGVIIDENGYVIEAQVFKRDSWLLEHEVYNVIYQWEFYNPNPFPIYHIITINFTLKDYEHSNKAK